MAAFDPAVALVLTHEGGFVDNPADPGGATNMGITLASLQAYRSRVSAPIRVVVSVDTLKALTPVEAKQVYRTDYWAHIRGDQITSQEVANHLLDMAVLRGLVAAVTSTQTILGLSTDGVMGPSTLAKLNAVPPALFLNLFRGECQRRFAAIVTARPTSLAFLRGWVDRAETMALTVSALLQKTSSQGAPAVS